MISAQGRRETLRRVASHRPYLGGWIVELGMHLINPYFRLTAIGALYLDEAEHAIHRALTISRRQKARMWELRAATMLAWLWRDQGRRAEAGDLLALVCSWFTEGFDTPDLKEAKALLDVLG